jgi:hypothetical protein
MINHVFIMSPLQGFRIREVTIRRFRCATPPVIHHAATSAAILLSQNNLLSQNKNYTEILPLLILWFIYSPPIQKGLGFVEYHRLGNFKGNKLSINYFVLLL